jgi:hypothetical protein
MSKVSSFMLIVASVLLTRLGDLYTTYLATPDLAEETNILVTQLGFGWPAFAISNAVLTGIVIFSAYYYYFMYRPAKVVGAENVSEYLSLAYFGDKNRFSDLFYRLPARNRLMQLGHIGYAFPRGVIVMGLLLMSNNLLNIQDGQYSSFLRTHWFSSYLKQVVYIFPFFFFLWYGIREEYRKQIHLITQ